MLTTETDTGSGGYTHPFFKAPHSADDLVAGRDAIAAWQRLTYGWMGRSPDYKAAFLATYGPNADYYAPFADNARRWYKEAQERVYFMNHTLVNPPVDRDKEIHEVSDVFIHAVKETDEGVVVRGAKMVATGSALSNYNFVSYHGNVPIKKEEYALSFFAPMDHPNIKLLCRPSYEFMAAAVGSPFDYPLSSRFDENDSVLMFDDALIPWENFLIYRNLEIASTYHLTGFIWRAMLQGCTRLAVKLDFIAGVFIKALEATGTIAFRGIQASVGEILAWRNTFWALTDAMCHNPVPSAEGSVIPNNQAGSAYRILSNIAIPKIKEIIENQVAGAMIVQPSHAVDWKNEELRPLLDQFYRGSNGYEAIDKIKVVKLLWDADRQRVRRPPRALRAHLLRQPRAHAPGVLVDGQRRRHRRPHEGLRRAVHGRVRPRRLDRRRPHQPRRHQPDHREVGARSAARVGGAAALAASAREGSLRGRSAGPVAPGPSNVRGVERWSYPLHRWEDRRSPSGAGRGPPSRGARSVLARHQRGRTWKWPRPPTEPASQPPASSRKSACGSRIAPKALR